MRTQLEPPAQQDAEARRNAVNGLIQFVTTHSQHLTNHVPVFECFVRGCEDYAVDKRGDVGSYVREASMKALEGLANMGKLSKQELEQVVGILLKQSCEKIDRVRDTAGNVLSRIVHNTNLSFNHQQFIKQLIDERLAHNQEEIKDLSMKNPQSALMDWSSAEETFPMLVQCLSLEQYRLDILSGLMISVGGLSSHVFKHSADALIKYIKQHDEQVIADGLVQLLKQYVDEERVNVPLLKAIGHLLSRDSFQSLTPDTSTFTLDVLQFIREHLTQTKNVQKIMYMVDICCEIVKMESSAMGLILGLLMSPYPKVREYTSQQLYSTLQIFDDILGDDLELTDKFFDVLSNTNWALRTVELRPIVQDLCDSVNTELIILKPPPTK
jgi:hypothetical protein